MAINTLTNRYKFLKKNKTIYSNEARCIKNYEKLRKQIAESSLSVFSILSSAIFSSVWLFSSLSLRGAVCAAWGPAGASTEAGWQDGPQMPEQEQHCCAGGQADAEPHYQARLCLSPRGGHRLAVHHSKYYARSLPLCNQYHSALLFLSGLSDRKAFYVIFTWDSGAQIYELVAQTVGERKTWASKRNTQINHICFRRRMNCNLIFMLFIAGLKW